MGTTQKYKFDDLFKKKPNGSFILKKAININGIKFKPGLPFYSGITFGGVDFSQFTDNDIAADDYDNCLEIKGFYKKQ